ncbi:MAG: zinc ribbon domain-containing protein [Tepidisphaeraceae bacterium]
MSQTTWPSTPAYPAVRSRLSVKFIIGVVFLVMGIVNVGRGPQGVVFIVIGSILMKQGSRATGFKPLANWRGVIPRPFRPIPKVQIYSGLFCPTCAASNDPRASRCRRCGTSARQFVKQAFQIVACEACNTQLTLPVDRFCSCCGKFTPTAE